MVHIVYSFINFKASRNIFKFFENPPPITKLQTYIQMLIWIPRILQHKFWGDSLEPL